MKNTIKAYPHINELNTNPKTGLLLLKDLGGLYSKMNNVSLYFYNMILTKETYPDISKIFRNLMYDEIHHMEILADICYHLGVDPRLWEIQHDLLQYWSPGYNIYPRTHHKMIENMINNEIKLMDIMHSQISMFDEPFMIHVFQKMIEEDQSHVEMLKARL